MVRSLLEVLKEAPDWRADKGKRYPLATVLTLSMLAMLNGQNSLRGIASWVKGISRQTRQRLGLRLNRTPSYSVIRTVLLEIDVVWLAGALQEWSEELVALLPEPEGWQGVAIDGKTLRGSGDKDEAIPALQMLNAVLHQLAIVVESHPIPESSSERGASQTALAELVLEGRVATFDALHTHRDTAKRVLEKGGTT